MFWRAFAKIAVLGLGNSHRFGQYEAVQQTGWLPFDKQDVKNHGCPI
jgi:hypothetical protein